MEAAGKPKQDNAVWYAAIPLLLLAAFAASRKARIGNLLRRQISSSPAACEPGCESAIESATGPAPQNPPCPAAVMTPPPKSGVVFDRRERATSEKRRVAALALLASAVLLLVGNLYLANHYLLRTSRHAAAASRSAADFRAWSAGRPWIRIEAAVPAGFIFSKAAPAGNPGVKVANNFGPGPDTAWLSVDLHYRNVGSTPALNVRIVPELYLALWSPGYAERVEAESASLCDAASSSSPAVRAAADDASAAQARHTLAPGDAAHQVIQVPAIITSGTAMHLANRPGSYILPALIGCVDYGSPSPAQHHRTRFVYELLHAQDPRPGTMTRFFRIDGSLDPNDLFLMRNEKDGAAD